jgi:hypothetical protein
MHVNSLAALGKLNELEFPVFYRRYCQDTIIPLNDAVNELVRYNAFSIRTPQQFWANEIPAGPIHSSNGPAGITEPL